MVTTLRKRLSEHNGYLSPDETRTRVLLIDPMLRTLGWDVLDPARVRLEHRDDDDSDTRGNKMDYVLFSENERPLAVVEAKRLADWPRDRARGQASGYAVALGAPYAFLTNGARWEGWEIRRGERPQSTMFVQVNVESGTLQEVARGLLPMHRDRLGSHPSSA